CTPENCPPPLHCEGPICVPPPGCTPDSCPPPSHCEGMVCVPCFGQPCGTECCLGFQDCIAGQCYTSCVGLSCGEDPISHVSCGSCTPPYECLGGECLRPTVCTCGDGICDTGDPCFETPTSCPADCGGSGT